MKFLVLLFFSLPLLGQTILIQNTTILSGNKRFPGDVFIQNGQIQEVAPMIRVPSETPRLDGTGKFLIPGLIDAHVHISQVFGVSPEQVEKNPVMAHAFNKQIPRSFLYWGFTTLIDLAGDPSKFQEFENSPLHPDLFHAGTNMTVANGYPMNYVPKEHRFDIFNNFIYLNTEKDRIPKRFLRLDHTPQACIQREISMGAHVIKAFYEPGFEGVKLPLPTVDIMGDIVSLAKENDLPVVVHANSLEAYQFISQFPFTATAHGLWNWGPNSGQINPLAEPIRSLLDKIQQNGTAYMPTLQVIDGLRALSDPHFLEDPELGNVIPKVMLDWYQTAEGQWFRDVFLDGRPAPEVFKVFTRLREQGQAALKYVNKDHVVFGTDTPSSMTYGNPPGYNGYKEIKQMNEAGMTPLEIFKAMTTNNAKIFNLPRRGRIEKGMIGSLVLLNRDPIESVTAYNKIHSVILHGHPIPRKSLSAKSNNN